MCPDLALPCSGSEGGSGLDEGVGQHARLRAQLHGQLRLGHAPQPTLPPCRLNAGRVWLPKKVHQRVTAAKRTNSCNYPSRSAACLRQKLVHDSSLSFIQFTWPRETSALWNGGKQGIVPKEVQRHSHDQGCRTHFCWLMCGGCWESASRTNWLASRTRAV